MKTFIFGHKNPDTDSLTSSVSLSYLKNKLGYNTVPKRLGELTKETKFVFEYFGVEEPEFMDNVKTQVKDLKHEKIDGISKETTIMECLEIMKEKEIPLAPIVSRDNKLEGIVSLKDIAVGLMEERNIELCTSISNIIKALNGKLLVKGKEKIEGKVAVIVEEDEYLNKELDENTTVVTCNNEKVLLKAIEREVRCILLSNNNTINENIRDKAAAKNISIISVEYDIYFLTKIVERCNNIDSVMNKNIIKFHEDDYLDTVKETMLDSKRRIFPVINEDNILLGFIGRNHIINPDNKKVILVDHNEYAQSAIGIEEAEIIEIVDHHKIGGIATSTPINFRNMSVGSSCTIVYKMFRENNIEIPKEIAGLLISGIVSDTLLFRSPTSTDIDREAVEYLNNILRLDLEEYSMAMFKAGTSLEGFTIEEIFFRDFKEFNLEGNKVGIGQVFTLDIDEVMEKKEEYLDFIDSNHGKNDYFLTILAITDIIKEGSYLLFKGNNESLITTAFDIENIQGAFVEGLVSRKKQIVPKITESYNIYK